MRETVIDQDIPLADDKRLIKQLWKANKSDNFPGGLEFAYQLLYLKNNEWIQVARIDNQLHEGKAGVHIHILKREKVGGSYNINYYGISSSAAEDRYIKMSYLSQDVAGKYIYKNGYSVIGIPIPSNGDYLLEVRTIVNDSSGYSDDRVELRDVNTNNI